MDVEDASFKMVIDSISAGFKFDIEFDNAAAGPAAEAPTFTGLPSII